MTTQTFAQMLALALIACAGTASTGTGEAAAPAGPQLFAPDDLDQRGRITFTPAISPDGQTLFFPQADCELIWQCPQELFMARRVGDGWSKPRKVAFAAGERVEWPSFSPDGRYLLFSWATKRARHAGQDVYEDFDLYRLDLQTPGAQPEPIDEPDINRVRGGKVAKLRFVNNETAPSLTQSGDLYFWTERLDGVGNRDVYVAPAAKGGGFAKARPLPAPINSPGNDSGVWVRPDGRLMLVNYRQNSSEEASDVFVSVRQGDGWSTPRKLGPAINSRFSEFAARLTPDGMQVLFTSDRPVGDGEAGLFQVWTTPVSALPVLQEALRAADS